MRKTIYDEWYKSFVGRLRSARERTGLTQIAVAKRLGCTQAYVSKIEAGQIRVDVLELKRLASMYKKRVVYFLK